MGQHLTALGLGLKASRTRPRTRPRPGDRLQQLQGLTDLIGREVHQLALELRPTALDDLGLESRPWRTTRERWSERSGVEVDFHAAGLDGGRLPGPAETALYRVVQEALTNVLKHAQSPAGELVLQRVPGQAVAVVEDDGVRVRRGVGDGPVAGRGAAGAAGDARAGGPGRRDADGRIRRPAKARRSFARIPLAAAGGGSHG